MIKRAFDVWASLLGCIALSPVLCVLAIIVKATSQGPVLYRGVRAGRFGRPFRIMKFRTMVVPTEGDAPSSTAGDDRRITGIGRFLRRWKLDELPQLVNVLTGDMSLVGPRPQVEWAVRLYSAEQQEILNLRPGLTDFASIVFRDEAEILKGASDPDEAYLRLIAPEKLRLSLYYCRHRSFAQDFRIIVATVLGCVGISEMWCFPADLSPIHPIRGKLARLR